MALFAGHGSATRVTVDASVTRIPAAPVIDRCACTGARPATPLRQSAHHSDLRQLKRVRAGQKSTLAEASTVRGDPRCASRLPVLAPVRLLGAMVDQ